MRIRVVGQAGEPVFPFGTNSPWAKFKNNLINKKDVLITQQFGEKIDALICHGYSKDAILEAHESKISKNKMVLCPADEMPFGCFGEMEHRSPSGGRYLWKDRSTNFSEVYILLNSF